MRLPFSYGLPVLRRDFRLRRILAVRIWLCLLFFYRMCNRIQGRTPVFVTWTFGICYDPSDVVSEMVHWCSHGLKLGVSEDPSDFCFWNGSCILDYLSSLVGIHQALVSEVDPLSVHYWLCLGSIRLLVSELDPVSVVIRTFSCWSDFNMRASVKHELLGHGFHDELFN